VRRNGGGPLAQVLLAVGGSTNGLVHWAAVAGRLGLKVDLNEFDAMGREVLPPPCPNSRPLRFLLPSSPLSAVALRSPAHAPRSALSALRCACNLSSPHPLLHAPDASRHVALPPPATAPPRQTPVLVDLKPTGQVDPSGLEWAGP
jgi:hypothetical protein